MYTIKSPNEKISITKTIGINSGETITVENVTITVYDWENNDVTTTIYETNSVSVSGSDVTVRVQDGTDGEKYKVVFNVATTNHIYEELYFVIVTAITDQYKNI